MELEVRCFLRSQGALWEIYWLKYDGNQVLCKCWGTYFDDVLGFALDEMHINYPEDGNVHYSYKSFSKDEKYYTGFHTHTKLKHVIAGKATKLQIPNEDAPDVKVTILNCMVPGPDLHYPLSKFSQAGTFFHFPTSGFPIPIPTSDYLKMYKTSKKMPNENDLVIDVDILESGTLCVIGFIASLDYPQITLKNNKWILAKKCPKLMIGICANHTNTS